MKQGFSPRRRLVLGLLGAGGALACGWAALPPRQRLHAAFSDPAAQSVALNGWVQIAPDGHFECGPSSKSDEFIVTGNQKAVGRRRRLYLHRKTTR